MQRAIAYFPCVKLGITRLIAGEPEAALRAFDANAQFGVVELDRWSPDVRSTRPDFLSFGSQRSAAPATHQDQGDGDLRGKFSGPWRHPAPQKALWFCRLSPGD
jgi:hypothetical protein